MEDQVAYLNDKANLDGRRAIMGRVRKETKKQTTAPMRHPPKPNSLHPSRFVSTREMFRVAGTHRSHLESAKYASSSFDLSLDLNGTYPPPLAIAL